MMTVVKWEQNGMPVAHKGGRGRPSLYDPAAVAAWVAARETNAADSSSLEEARIRKELSQAALNEQRLAVMEGKLLPAEEVEKAWAREVAAVRTAIMATYATASDRVARAHTLDGVAGVEHELKAIAHEILRELSEGKHVAPKKRPRKAKAA
jgi:phage terminase Nu1 subunit (DNA packaging protein)